jgi:hypothetical protein
MDTMQQELGDAAVLLGVNAVGYDSANESFTSDVDLPWLQDTMAEAAWELWGAEWRDVWILDTQGRLHAKIDLNSHDLGWDEDYQAVKELIEEAAER